MQNDLFEKWYSLSFPNSSLERNEDGSYFRRKTNFSLESFEAGQQSKQKEIDELNLTIKRLIASEEDIARGCKHWRDAHRELDERVGYILKVCENLKNDSLRENHKEYDKGWRDCASSILHQLR